MKFAIFTFSIGKNFFLKKNFSGRARGPPEFLVKIGIFSGINLKK